MIKKTLQLRTCVQNLSIKVGRIYEDNEENKKVVKPVRLTHYTNEGLFGQSEYEMILVATGKT